VIKKKQTQTKPGVGYPRARAIPDNREVTLGLRKGSRQRGDGAGKETPRKKKEEKCVDNRPAVGKRDTNPMKKAECKQKKGIEKRMAEGRR